MRFQLHILSALVASLLLASTSAFAVKPTPADCPCYPIWLGVTGGTSCVLISSGDRVILPHGDFIKSLTVFEQIGDACYLLAVESSGYVHDVCETTLGTVIQSGEGELDCVDTTFTESTYLSSQQIRDCSFVLQQLTVDIGSLPDCEQP